MQNPPVYIWKYKSGRSWLIFNLWVRSGALASAMTKKKSRRDPVKDKIKDDRRMKRLTKALR